MIPGQSQGTLMISDADLADVMNPSERVQALTEGLLTGVRKLDALIDFFGPYVEGLGNLPRDGRFLLVANHTQFALAEVFLIPYFVQRELGVRVRPLAERGIAQLRGPMRDFMTACGAVVGHPDTAAELMRHSEPVLVFPGGSREISKFKGEEYQLRWQGRSGFARVAIAHNYPIVPVGLVGGDDVYRSMTARNGIWGKLSQSVASKLSGRTDMAMPLLRGVGPTLIPRPERMYLSFATLISTTKPARTPAEAWEGVVKQRTQDRLESVLTDLLSVREHDSYRSLNPARRRRAARPG